MNSFILIGKNQQDIQTYLNTFSSAHKIGPMDVSHIQDTQAIGIERIRLMQESIYLKPFNSPEKMLVIDDADTLTVEAQNAMLKLLEEPPASTHIFLVSPYLDVFLPTVISRCQLVQLGTHTAPDTNKAQMEAHLLVILEEQTSPKLKLAEEITKEKDNIGSWFAHMTLFIRDKMLEDITNTTYPVILYKLQEGNKLLQTTNVSHRALLEHVFLT